jgi:hypothetical protein
MSRTTEGYARLAEPFFETVRPVSREDLLRVPYTLAIRECDGPRPAPRSKEARHRLDHAIDLRLGEANPEG